jgi:elongator complex protein 3
MFLSYEIPSSDILIGYARLRIPSEGSHALVRELHVYGQMVPIEEDPGRRWQHRGYGEKLLAECERVALSRGMSELMVTSGVGARGYYRALGYERKGQYMAKRVARP